VENSSVAAPLAAAKEGLSSMELEYEKYYFVDSI
jgi:hypothetical protein